AAAITLAVVAADEVVVERVVIGARANRDAASTTVFTDIGLNCSVIGDLVVVDADVVVISESEPRTDCGRQRLAFQIRLADADTAGEGSGISIDPVIGDGQVVSPTVDVDPATSVAASDADSVDAGWRAEEITREPAVVPVIPKRLSVVTQSLRQNRNASAFLGAQD